MAEALSSYRGVGPSGGKPNSVRIKRRYRAVLAADTAAMNSASVEEQAVVVACVLDFQTTSPPDRAKP